MGQFVCGNYIVSRNSSGLENPSGKDKKLSRSFIIHMLYLCNLFVMVDVGGNPRYFVITSAFAQSAFSVRLSRSEL